MTACLTVRSDHLQRPNTSTASLQTSALKVGLSLGEDQRSEVTPETSVSAIKAIKKSRKASEDKTSVEVVSDPVELVQTSGLFPVKSSDDKMTFSSVDYSCFFSFDNSGEIFLDFNLKFTSLIDDFSDFLEQFSLDVSCFTNIERESNPSCSRCFLNDIELAFYHPDKFKQFFDQFFPLYSAAYARYLELSEGGDN